MRRRPSRRCHGRRKDSLEGMMYTLQVAPEDCTGCGACVDVCPTRSKEVVKHKAINMAPKLEHLEAERANYEFFLSLPEVAAVVRHDRRAARLAAAAAAVRILGRLLRVRRDAVPEAAVAALRRPSRHRQRHRLLVDLRRQPAVNAVLEERRRAGTDLGQQPVRGQRGVRPRHAARARLHSRNWRRCWWRNCVNGSGRNWRTHCSRRAQDNDEQIKAQRGESQAAEGDAAEARRAGSGAAAGGRRQPGGAQRLDRRRRRLGLRHRLRRARPRARLRPQRQHPGARHRGLQQHRRPGVEVDAARRGGQVRRGRQVDRQEGPRHDRDGVRQRVRRAGRDGRQPGAHACARSRRRRRGTGRR